MRVCHRIGVGILGVMLVAACSSDDDGGGPPADAPVVNTVSDDTVAPGDTLVIGGSNFASPASANNVRFTNPLSSATPFAGDANSLSVVVDRDATTGPVTVTSNGLSGNGPSVEVQRGIGDVFVFGGLGASLALALPNPTAATRYLIVPHAMSAGIPYNRENSYRIDSSLEPPVAALPATGGAGTMTIREAFEASRWEQTRELISRVGYPVPSEENPASRATTTQQFRVFNVLATTSNCVLSPSCYDQVTARLRYNGSSVLIYTDIDTLASGNFSQADLNDLGTTFDSSIEPTDVTYFGSYSDVDGNDRVIILISPVVNRLTPPGSGGFIAGFFLPIDLYSVPAVPAGTTNRAEMLYLIAADPGGFWGNSFPVAFAAEENIGTSAHELEHLISFSRRLLVEDGPSQETWLEEGMAHMAEDLNGIDTANQNRADLYLDDPGGISLEHQNAPLEQRGGIYLFLRLMVDRYGTDILKDIVQSKCTGRACVQSVTGQSFADLVGEFFAALYLSGRGITADPRYNYSSIDLADYGQLQTSLHAAGVADVTGTVRRSGGDFHLFTGALNDNTKFIFTDVTRNSGLRHTVVRVQ